MNDDRFTFEPVYDLHTARVSGFSIAPARPQDAIGARARGTGWSARQIAEVDAGTAVSAVALARRLDPGAAVQVPVAADTVVLARDRLRAMLTVGGTAPMLEIGPALAAAPVDELVPALAELRGWGFRIALDGIGRGFGLDLLLVARPDVAVLEEHLSAPGSAAVVRAVCGVAAASGVRVAATGVADADALGALHACGARLARGPLLGTPRARPVVEGSTPPELLSLLTATAPHRSPSAAPSPGPAPSPRPTPSPAPRIGAVPVPVRALASAALTLPDDAVADVARTALADRPDAGGVVLLDPRRRPTGYLERSRFLLAMAGPFGHALWAAKPAITMADPPRVADERMPLPAAMEVSLAGDRSRGYDDLVLVGPGGACTGVVPVSELWRRSMRRTDVVPPPGNTGPPNAGTGGGPRVAPHPVAGSLRRHPGDGPLREARSA
ncbi:EAL domain-containing protein (putative c-di-GMP-specific phosphodiesterase class I) [Pseudonocardia sediminis]|uniref:EAL domain-containing protein (Putative c-di-GMP-specific phosphodiesterase class I) n=1 Tax=Pseudonocardia sediminis TaxID=1397368 RepID=A0A4Q7UVB4_PSEST|nr:EAL domain-containing protein [Pseudonocardia sediminis]RZT83999.1 EAL domain-containing protein (putative c-di-GMP-specific phosphodiesterase class I) [Pseudonocardia sediminis]